MSDEIELQEHIGPESQPDADALAYDLDSALAAIVSVRARIPEDAFTASILGTERSGHGVRILETGLVVTIGYVIAEAEEIWLVGANGQAVTGHVVGYDYETGFGLVQPLGSMDLPILELGDSDSMAPGDQVVVAGCGGITQALEAEIVAKREFAGYWEYVLDEALFTAPAHPQWGGTALVGENGRLLGIGSLLVQEAIDGQTVQGNMMVPIDLLDPILDDMLNTGRSSSQPRPWLGMYTTESEKNLVVGGLAEGGPAASAGIKQGDLVLEVAGTRITSLAGLFRTAWQLGPAGTIIPLTVARDGDVLRFEVRSADRNDFLKKPPLH